MIATSMGTRSKSQQERWRREGSEDLRVKRMLGEEAEEQRWLLGLVML